MPTIARDTLDDLAAAVHAHDHLQRLLGEIEHLQRVVFHGQEPDQHRLHRSAEQILVADIVSRYHGDIERLHAALRRMEKDGRGWSAAVKEMAGYIHSYFTTPLGIVMRRDLFGEDAVFLSPDALAWIRKSRGS